MNSKAYSINPNILVPQPKKIFGIERLRALGATVFSETAKPEEAEKWLWTLENCLLVN